MSFFFTLSNQLYLDNYQTNTIQYRYAWLLVNIDINNKHTDQRKRTNIHTTTIHQYLQQYSPQSLPLMSSCCRNVISLLQNIVTEFDVMEQF